MRRYLFIAAMVVGLAVVGVIIVRVVGSNADRTNDLCDYAHQQQVDKRTDAIEGYQRIPPAAREKLVIAGITLHPRRDLIRDLHGKYGNGRAPDYCSQRDWPEDERKWPRELRG